MEETCVFEAKALGTLFSMIQASGLADEQGVCDSLLFGLASEQGIEGACQNMQIPQLCNPDK